jgi:tryptophan synthase beta subunit
MNTHRADVYLFTVCNYPDRETFIETLFAIEETGLVDAIEVGIPYSDPIADGPVIQDRYTKVLNADYTTSIKDVMGTIIEARRRGFKTPAILMGYMNTIFRYEDDTKTFAMRDNWGAMAAEAGVKQIILTDCTFEGIKLYKLDTILQECGVEIIPVISKVIDDASYKTLCENDTMSLVYCANYLGVTGKQNVDMDAIPQDNFDVKYIEQVRNLPSFGKRALMGFGISGGHDITKVGDKYNAHACVIGTQFLRVSAGCTERAAIKAKVEQMLEGVRPRMAPGSAPPVAPSHTTAVLPTVTNYQLKVCGFKFYNEVVAALMDSVTYFGFIFVPKSKRYYGLDRWEELRRTCRLISTATLPGYFDPKPIAVFQYDGDKVFDDIRTVLTNVPELSAIQLYGFPVETKPALEALVSKSGGKLQIIFCLSVSEALDASSDKWAQVAAMDAVWAVCVDKPNGASLGGNGVAWEQAHYEAVPNLKNPQNKPLFIAGGVSVANARDIKKWIGHCASFGEIVLDASSAAEPTEQDDDTAGIGVACPSSIDGDDLDGYNFFDNLSSSKCTLSQPRPWKDMYKVRQLARAVNKKLPSFFGGFGGQFVPQTILMAVAELSEEYTKCQADPTFWKEMWDLYKKISGRPTGLYEATKLTEAVREEMGDGEDAKKKGASIWLKREDLLHTGAHKINNAIFQCIIARRMGKTRVIAETGAGQHGVATATVCAYFGLKCMVYMGAKDVARQALNVRRMQLLGTTVVPCHSGDATLGTAINEAMRDWCEHVLDTHYIIGSALGPSPFPCIVRDAHSVISREARRQLFEKQGCLPSAVIACVGGGSNAIGMFDAYIGDPGVRLVGSEAAGAGPTVDNMHCVSIGSGSGGVLHGSINTVLQTQAGQTMSTHSVSAGLDYPGVSPLHCFLFAAGRAEFMNVDDVRAFSALEKLAETEGIIAALETSHAVQAAIELSPTLGRDEHIVVSLSGRGDKDMEIITEFSADSQTVIKLESLVGLLQSCVNGAPSAATAEEATTIKEGVEAVIACNMHDHRSTGAVIKLFDSFNACVESAGDNVRVLSALMLQFRTSFLDKCASKDILQATMSSANGCDIVGTGGDKKNTHNVSTPAGILAAASGKVNVIKHGNVSASSNSGSADVLAALGADCELAANVAVMTNTAGEEGGAFCFLFARKLHPVVGKFGPLRVKYGKRSIFNILGPLLNPFVKTGVYGVTKQKIGEIYANVYHTVVKQAGEGARAWIVMSEDNVDKISPLTSTVCWDVTPAGISTSTLPPYVTSAPDAGACYGGGGGPKQNAGLILDAFAPIPKGDCTPEVSLLRDFIVVNAAAVLAAAGKADSLAAGCFLLQETIESGIAMAGLERYIYDSNHLGTKQGVLKRICNRVGLRAPLDAPEMDLGAPRSLYDALRAKGDATSVIAEIKLRSPSYKKCAHSPEALMDAYIGASPGPVAISVLTEPTYFGGSLQRMFQVKQASLAKGANGPIVLRKDFILTTEQVDESIGWGADAVLLIVKCLGSKLHELHTYCVKRGIEPLVEVVNEAEMDLAVECGAKIIGVNNRNLDTFQMNVDTSVTMLNYLKQKYPEQAAKVAFISLSGIGSDADVVRLSAQGIHSFLVGTAFTKAGDPMANLESMVKAK